MRYIIEGRKNNEKKEFRKESYSCTVLKHGI